MRPTDFNRNESPDAAPPSTPEFNRLSEFASDSVTELPFAPEPGRPGSLPRIARVDVVDTTGRSFQSKPPILPAPANPTPQGGTLFGALRRRWLLALVLGLLFGGAAAAAVWFFMPVKYTAFALLRVASSEPKLMFNTAENKSEFSTYLKTQAALLKSPLVLNAALRDSKVKDLPLVRQQPDPVTWLTNELKVESTAGSEVLRISLLGDSPRELALIVNAVKNAYMQEVVEAEQKQRRGRLQELEQVYAESEEKVRTKRNALRQLARTLGTSDSQALTLKQQIALQHFAELKKEHQRIEFELMRAKVEALTLQGRSKAIESAQVPETYIEQVIDADPVVQQTLVRIAQIQDVVTRYQQVAARADDPSLVRYQKELAAATDALKKRRDELRPTVADRMRERAKTESDFAASKGQERIALLIDQEKLLRAEVERHGKDVDKIGVSSSDLELMRAEIDQVDVILKKVGGEIEAQKIESRSRPRVASFQDAETPQGQDMRRQAIAAALAGVVGFGLMALLVAWLELRARHICRAAEVPQELGLRVIGALPSASNVAQRRVSDSLHDGDIYNNFTESIDALRALILHNANVEPTRVLLVTSAVSGEGKTTLASHLAASLARAGRKTLLVDGDLRRPAAHVQFDLPLGPGLSEVIRGEVEVDEVIRQTAAPDLSMITAGKADREVLQALARGGLGKTFDMLRMHFDFVILDSSPVLPVSDALLLGQQADAVLFSIRRGVSQVPKAQAACEKLASVGVRVLGAVINGEDQVTPGCYSSPTGAYPTTSRSRKLEEANAA